MIFAWSPARIQIGQDHERQHFLLKKPFQPGIIEIDTSDKVGFVGRLNLQMAQDPLIATVDQADFEK